MKMLIDFPYGITVQMNNDRVALYDENGEEVEKWRLSV